MDAECIRSELRFRVSRPHGPGGQHAQKNSTRVEVLFDVNLLHFPPTLRAGVRYAYRQDFHNARIGPAVEYRW